MKSNRIQIKFSSESHYEKFTFNSETITYQEIIDYLVRKKKLGDFASKKTDSITLLNVDKNLEISSGIVDAGARLIVIRKPEGATITPGCLIGSAGGTKSDSIELTYNPKQTIDRNRVNREKIVNILNSNPALSVSEVEVSNLTKEEQQIADQATKLKDNESNESEGEED